MDQFSKPGVVIPFSGVEHSCDQHHTYPNNIQNQFKWTVHDASVDLPALLNDPRLSRRETDFFTKTWGSSFVKSFISDSAYIPKIDRLHFEQYLCCVVSVSYDGCLCLVISCQELCHLLHGCL